MKKIFAYLLIIIGIIIMLIPTFTNFYLKSKVKESVKDVIEMEPIELEKNLDNEAEFDYSIIEDIEVTSTLLNENKANKDLIIGQLTIPSINLNITVFKGINNTNLLAGSATMREDQIMGQGNYPIAGHYSKNKNVLFGALMDVKVGDIIKLTDKKNIYEYKVYEASVVPDTAVYYIDDEISKIQEKPVISLMTCYYSSKTGKRFFAMGELNSSYPYEESLMYKK